MFILLCLQVVEKVQYDIVSCWNLWDVTSSDSSAVDYEYVVFLVYEASDQYRQAHGILIVISKNQAPNQDGQSGDICNFRRWHY